MLTEIRKRVKFLSSDGIVVFCRAQKLADFQNLVLSFQSAVFFQRRRNDQFCRDSQIFVDKPKRFGIVLCKIFLFTGKNFLHKWEYFIIIWGLAVCPHQLIQIFPDQFWVIVDTYFVDMFHRACTKHWYIKVFWLVIDQNAVPVNPTALDKIHIIVNHIFIDRIHQLPITNVRHKIRLHNTKFHRNDSLLCRKVSMICIAC